MPWWTGNDLPTEGAITEGHPPSDRAHFFCLSNVMRSKPLAGAGTRGTRRSPVPNKQNPSPYRRAADRNVSLPPTSLKAVEEELLRMKDRLQRASEADSGEREMGFFESILCHDDRPLAVLRNGMHCFVNPPYCAFVGRPKEQLLGHHFQDLLEPGQRQAYAATISVLEGLAHAHEAPLGVQGDFVFGQHTQWRLQPFRQGMTGYVKVEPTLGSLPLSFPSDPSG